ncbi:hypothetical protein PRN20_18870 [Devosia sp. ZB163]|uniref:hypothetical protein n=1 Tax=Devosia sp. ZB163 TaxID=3025938 RepID=UPI00235E9CD5|nr:hypothetical protein [Devosia sp. ZB163]MDC9825802.1 hypothetical protein [Devosia sp. ZB163]
MASGLADGPPYCIAKLRRDESLNLDNDLLATMLTLAHAACLENDSIDHNFADFRLSLPKASKRLLWQARRSQRGNRSARTNGLVCQLPGNLFTQREMQVETAPNQRHRPLYQLRRHEPGNKGQSRTFDGAEHPAGCADRFTTGDKLADGTAGNPTARRSADIEAKPDPGAHSVLLPNP